MNDKDYEIINEAANKVVRALDELTERISPLIEELAEKIAGALSSALNNEELMQKLIDEAEKKAVQDAQEKQTYNITEVKDISTGYAEPYHKITANARSNLR